MSEAARNIDLMQGLTPEPTQGEDASETAQAPEAFETSPAPAAPEPARAMAAPMAPEIEDDTCDLMNARIPHISISVFRETEAFYDVWSRVSDDRRMVSATTAVYEGGLPAAISKYKAEKTPDLLIVETDSDETVLEYEIDCLAEVADPGTQLIVIGHKNDISLYQKLLNMGVSNYLVYPVTVPGVIQSISEIYKEPGKEKIGKVHAVIGAKGGVGASSVAQSVALELSLTQGADILLVDMDLCFGTASLNLDIEPNQGLIEMIDQAERIDVAMLDRVLIKRGLNLNVLGSNAGLDTSRELDAFAVERMLDVAASHIPQIVLDIPHSWNEWVERCLTAADTVTVVATPELSSLRNATTLMTQLKTLRPNDKPPALVMNQVGMPRRQEISAKEVSSILKINPMVSIPHDPRVFSRAASQGKMVAELGRKKPIAQAFATIAKELVPPPNSPAQAAAASRKLLKR